MTVTINDLYERVADHLIDVFEDHYEDISGHVMKGLHDELLNQTKLSTIDENLLYSAVYTVSNFEMTIKDMNRFIEQVEKNLLSSAGHPSDDTVKEALRKMYLTLPYSEWEVSYRGTVIRDVETLLELLRQQQER